ncbi:putative sporulation protein YtxC [Neobacillus niacini]|uniref:putative sporulation protein YtxC n=1 Tax=Neobacillus niacini TaxID=86668 RepID=UPI0021CAED77|nr:putative sporulation protein YtxC [Neobacillus niacini]MCM3767232.1 putative sporulation protein YtxC [Neobacillus niacini]
MAEIIFHSKQDANKFYHHLRECLKYDPDYENILLFEDRHIVKVLNGSVSEEFFQQFKGAFYDFITVIKREDWFREILMNQFYFEDFEEQQQILEILYSIMDGQREDLSHFLKDSVEEPNVKEAIEHVLQENVSFSFDSFVKFRLRSYLELLESYVEISIDEYKMEQEYQMFVQMLRDFLANREPKMEKLHLLFDDEITFYNEELQEIKRGELTKMIDRRLLVNHPVYVDSASIAPLLSLAPTAIFLYVKDEDAPLVRTIKNIFEERVIVRAYHGLRELKNREGGGTSAKNHG